MATATNPKVDVARAFTGLWQPARYKVRYGGRGGAKSHAFAEALLVQGHHVNDRVVCTREFQSSIRESVHFLLAQKVSELGLADAYQVNVQSIDHRYRDTRFFFFGLHHNADAIKSTEGITKAWVEEAATVSESSWDFLIPTIRQESSEIWVSFNPRFKYDATTQRFIVKPPPAEMNGQRYADIAKVSWRDNPWFPDVLRTEMEMMREQDYEKYLHIWEGEFKQITEGAIFGKQIIDAKRDGRVCALAIEPNVDIDTSWDLGKNDATAVWFWQRLGKEHRAVGYLEERGEDIDWWCAACRSWMEDNAPKNGQRRLKLNFGTHFMPHDVESKLFGMPNTRKKQFEIGGIKPIRVVPRVRDKGEAIAMGRKLFPNVYFDKERCEHGLDVLANYHYEFDEDRNSFKLVPYHDWASNGADAFMQMAQANPSTKKRGPTPQPEIQVY